MTQDKPQKIWAGTDISVIGLTGQYSSGKTLFGMTIDPKRTLYYDHEKSGGSYDGLGVVRVDVPEVLQQRHPKGYTPRQAFEWWYSDVKKIEKGKYSVIFTDPVSDIEEGLVEWVKSRHSEWGFKSAQSFESTGGIFWAKVKSTWKQVLTDLSARCQSFVFTTHLKHVWKHGKPTDKVVPKGKTTLMELSSLYLFLEREPPKEGAAPPMVPSAIVLKSRLATTKLTEEGLVEVLPILPPRLPKATPAEIRKYILNPPDYTKLKPSEKDKGRKMSDDDRLELQRDIAADTRAAEEAALEAAKARVQAEEAKEAAKARLRPAPDRAQEVRKNQAEASRPNKGNEEKEPITEDAKEAHKEEGSKVKEDNGPSEEVEKLKKDAESAGVFDRVKSSIDELLQSKGVECNGEFNAHLLSPDDFARFRKGVDTVLSKAKK